MSDDVPTIPANLAIVCGEVFVLDPVAAGFIRAIFQAGARHLSLSTDRDYRSVLFPSTEDQRIPSLEEFDQLVASARQVYAGMSEARLHAVNTTVSLVKQLLDAEDEMCFDGPRRPGSVYVIHGGHYFYKIGMTDNLPARLRQLSTASPFPLTVIHHFQVRSAAYFERLLHTWLAQYRVKGEWFNLPGDVLADLKAIHQMIEPNVSE